MDQLDFNTIVTEDGDIIFLNERKISRKEKQLIQEAKDELEHLNCKYGTVDIWELMDRNIRFNEMKQYLSARYYLHKRGLDDLDFE